MYDANHPTVKRGMADAFRLLPPIFEDRESVIIGVSDGRLVIEEEHIQDLSPTVARLVKLIGQRKIASFELMKGLDLDEFEVFVKLIASKDESLWDDGQLRPDVAALFKHLRMNEIRFKMLRPGSEGGEVLDRVIGQAFKGKDIPKDAPTLDRKQIENATNSLIQVLGKLVPGGGATGEPTGSRNGGGAGGGFSGSLGGGNGGGPDGGTGKGVADLSSLEGLLKSMVKDQRQPLKDIKQNLVKVLTIMGPAAQQAVTGKVVVEGEDPDVNAVLSRLSVDTRADILSAELQRKDLSKDEISEDLAALVGKSTEVVEIAELISGHLSGMDGENGDNGQFVARLFNLVQSGALRAEALKPTIQGTVYIADEESETSELFHEITQRYGCRFEMFHSGAELLDAVKQKVPDLLIVSAQVSGMSAPKLLSELRVARIGAPAVPAIVCATSHDCRKEFDLLTYPEYTFVEKPCETQVMVDAIGRYLTIYKPNDEDLGGPSKDLAQDLEKAHSIQESLLPKKLPEIPNCQFGVHYGSCKEVGGDYYDVLDLGNGRYGIFIADVSGKAVAGAMVMVMVRSVFRMIASQGLSPHETIVKVNQLLTEDMLRGMFVTAIYIDLDTKTREARIVNAGHNPPVLWRSSAPKPCLLKLKGIALGVVSGKKFESTVKQGKLELASGDLLYVYTDGIVESQNREGEEFGEHRLCQVIMKHRESSPDEVIKAVLDAVVVQRADAPQHDDITTIALRIS